ncbi:hypothetical protein HD554DRAFT_2176249 [Boletus coccyginus]|nr:hypothetical protein HD554DRAFT_2176249 [Boletus coccyginus]
MTLMNKFVVSGRQFNMTLLLSLQSIDAKAWLPVSAFLVIVIYYWLQKSRECLTRRSPFFDSWIDCAKQYLTIPVYTIFKNLTIILIAYGEI